jgi:hypothetical protein
MRYRNRCGFFRDGMKRIRRPKSREKTFWFVGRAIKVVKRSRAFLYQRGYVRVERMLEGSARHRSVGGGFFPVVSVGVLLSA